MEKKLQDIINEFRHTRAVIKGTLVVASRECDLGLMLTCQDAIRKLDEAIAESNRVMQMLQAR